MQVSATPFDAGAEAAGIPSALRLRRETPLVRLQRSGERRVWLKHEGAGVSGSIYDRVVRARASRRTPAHVVVDGATPFAYAVALGLRPRGCQVTVVTDKEASKRLRTLLRGAGATVRFEVESGPSRLASIVASGAERWAPSDDAWAAERAYRDIADEVGAQLGVRPAAWVVPNLGLSAARAAAALQTSQAALVLVDDDHGQRRTLDGMAACRRQQVAHREGILLSPMGAEIVDAAVGLSERSGVVCAVIPEDGRRYVGWW